MSPSFSQRYADYIVNNPWRLLLLSIIVLFVMASGGRFLHFSNDYREFFSADNPELLAFDEMQNTYNKADNVMFVFAPEKGDVFSRETLRLVTEVTNKSWQIPYSSRVDSISNYQHTVADGDDLIVANLVTDTEDLNDSDLAYIRNITVNEPLLVNRLVSAKGHVTAINVCLVKHLMKSVRLWRQHVLYVMRY